MLGCCKMSQVSMTHDLVKFAGNGSFVQGKEYQRCPDSLAAVSSLVAQVAAGCAWPLRSEDGNGGGKTLRLDPRLLNFSDGGAGDMYDMERAVRDGHCFHVEHCLPGKSSPCCLTMKLIGGQICGIGICW